MTNNEAWNTPHNDGYVPPTGPSKTKSTKPVWRKHMFDNAVGGVFVNDIDTSKVYTHCAFARCNRPAKFWVWEPNTNGPRQRVWSYCGHCAPDWPPYN